MWGQRLLLVGALSLSACSATKFGASKDTVLGKGVFGDYRGQLTQPDAAGNGITQGATNGEVGGRINQGEENGDASGGINQGAEEGGTQGAKGGVKQPDGTNDEVDFLLMCSDSRSEEAANFKRAVAENLPVQLLIDSKICTSDINVIRGLITKKSFTIADAKAICPPLVPVDGTWSNVTLVVDGEATTARRGTITVLYALNNETKPAEQVADALCDKRSSPLVIHLNSDPTDPQPVALSAPENGVNFDLLGARTGHQSVRISWFTNREYGLLTLPDASGRVRGIDQLFGNSTLGPDGLFAENGYTALAKYDGTTADGVFHTAAADGFIDPRDPVFERLRVWVDRNRDGVAQPRELSGLREARITFIDLSYSSDYAETDVHGNQTLMKSVVGRTDNSLDLIFDVWFAFDF